MALCSKLSNDFISEQSLKSMVWHIKPDVICCRSSLWSHLLPLSCSFFCYRSIGSNCPFPHQACCFLGPLHFFSATQNILIPNSCMLCLSTEMSSYLEGPSWIWAFVFSEFYARWFCFLPQAAYLRILCQLGFISGNANMRLENGRREKGGRHMFLFLRLHLQAAENLSNGSSFLGTSF